MQVTLNCKIMIMKVMGANICIKLIKEDTEVLFFML